MKKMMLEKKFKERQKEMLERYVDGKQQDKLHKKRIAIGNHVCQHVVKDYLQAWMR